MMFLAITIFVLLSLYITIARASTESHFEIVEQINIKSNVIQLIDEVMVGKIFTKKIAIENIVIEQIDFYYKKLHIINYQKVFAFKSSSVTKLQALIRNKTSNYLDNIYHINLTGSPGEIHKLEYNEKNHIKIAVFYAITVNLVRQVKQSLSCKTVEFIKSYQEIFSNICQLTYMTSLTRYG